MRISDLGFAIVRDPLTCRVPSSSILPRARAWNRLPPVRRGASRRHHHPNILLITIDTLRADRVGRGLTPAVDGAGAARRPVHARAQHRAADAAVARVDHDRRAAARARRSRQRHGRSLAGTPTIARVLARRRLPHRRVRRRLRAGSALRAGRRVRHLRRSRPARSVRHASSSRRSAAATPLSMPR